MAAPSALAWSVNSVLSIEPCRLNSPEENRPEANSLSFQAARVTAAPMPRTTPPARTARSLRERADRSVDWLVVATIWTS